MERNKGGWNVDEGEVAKAMRAGLLCRFSPSQYGYCPEPPGLGLGIVTGSVNPPGFMPGSERVRVRVGIFYPGQNPYPVRGFGGYW